MFAIKSLKIPSSNFDITKYISFNVRSTRSAAQAKLKHVTVLNNKQDIHILTDFLAFGTPSLPFTYIYRYIKTEQ